jgi:hypothetical protein
MKTSYSLADKTPEVSIIPVEYALRTFWDDIHRNRLKRYGTVKVFVF